MTIPTILIADDYQSNIAVIESIFEEANRNYRLLYAYDGARACELALEERPDLIIMDWDMPEMSGLEAVEWIKAREEIEQIPIIMTTAYTSSEHLERAMRSGAMDYVRKPIDTVELLARVSSALKIISSYKQILAQRDEIEEKSRRLNEAFQEIEEKNDKILSSINYARRIQYAMLPQIKSINTALPHSFVYFKPRDIVSGDFYWHEQRNGKTIIAAADCTGHGVPGAFMAMLGTAYMNQIVNVMGITSPDDVLNSLHLFIHKALNQESGQNNDGMDISVCVIDHEERKLSFAGARSPLVYVQNKVLYQIKGDRFSIGGNRKFKPYQKHEISFIEPTTFYIYSDGYQDQFSSHLKSKFLAKRFRKLLLKIHKYPMNEQEGILDSILQDWMRDTRQIDDVLVIGFRP
ncbi:MAG: PP2C family protein-serine/threonine phosphatase [Bernardetiaceae bacterium]